MADGRCQCCGSATNLLCETHAEEQFDSDIGEPLRARVAELETLAYIGDHHFPDLTWKARVAELECETEAVGASLVAVPHSCGSHRHIPCAGCEAAKIAQSAPHVHSASERSQRIAAAESRALAAEKRVKQLEDALRRIADPVDHFQSEAERTGSKLNEPMAVSLSNNAAYLKQEARAALAAGEDEAPAREGCND